VESAGSGEGLTDQRNARGVRYVITRLTARWPRVTTGGRRGGQLGGRARPKGLAALLRGVVWLLTLPFRLLRAWARDAWIAFQRRGYLLIAH
jgi:hypothetical protein